MVVVCAPSTRQLAAQRASREHARRLNYLSAATRGSETTCRRQLARTSVTSNAVVASAGNISEYTSRRLTDFFCRARKVRARLVPMPRVINAAYEPRVYRRLVTTCDAVTNLRVAGSRRNARPESSEFGEPCVIERTSLDGTAAKLQPTKSSETDGTNDFRDLPPIDYGTTQPL